MALILGVMLSSSIIPCGLYAVFFFNKTKAQIIQQSASSLLKSNHDNSRNIASWISGHEAAVRTVALSSDLAAMDPVLMRDYLVKVNAEMPVFYAFTAISKDGIQVARSNTDKLINVSDRPYFKESIEGSRSVIHAVISKTNGKTFFNIAVPIRNTAKEIVGVLSAVAESRPIGGKINSAKLGLTGFSYLVNSDGTVLAHPLNVKVGMKVPENVFPLLKTAKQGQIIEMTTPENIEIQVTSGSVTNDLILVTQIDKSEVELALEVELNSFLILGLSAMGLAVMLSWLLAKTLALKINLFASIVSRIARARNEVELVNMEKQIDNVGGVQELQHLGLAIKQLGSAIRLTMREQPESDRLSASVDTTQAP